MRLPVALLLALAFLAAFTVMQRYSPETYDVVLTLAVAGSHGAATETDGSVSYSCYRTVVNGACGGLYINLSVVTYARVSGNCTESEVAYFGTDGFGGPYRLYLCAGSSAGASAALPPPERRHGLLRRSDVGVHVHAQAGRIVMVGNASGYTEYNLGTAGWCVELSCEDGSWCLGQWATLSARGEVIEGVADALYVFVRLDQPASLVEVVASRGGSETQSLAAAPPEEGPDLSGVVAARPVAVRLERGRFYVRLAATRADGGEMELEVPADAGIRGRAWGECHCVTAWYVNASRCSYPGGCACTGEIPYWLFDCLQANLWESPPVAARGGAVALPVGRHALLFVLAWPAPLNAAAWGANYTVTVIVRGARPVLTR